MRAASAARASGSKWNALGSYRAGSSARPTFRSVLVLVERAASVTSGGFGACTRYASSSLCAPRDARTRFEQRRRRTRRRASRPRTCARSGTSPLRSIPSPWTRWERHTRLRARSSVATRLARAPPEPEVVAEALRPRPRRTRRFAPHSAPGWRSCSRPSGGATAIPSGARATPPSATMRTRTSSASTATVSSSGFEKTRISVGYTKATRRRLRRAHLA